MTLFLSGCDVYCGFLQDTLGRDDENSVELNFFSFWKITELDSVEIHNNIRIHMMFDI